MSHQNKDHSTDDDSSDDPVVIPIKPEIDLHYFRPHEVGPVVREYLIAAHELGYINVVLIHGKGLGIQRENVRQILTKTDFVESFQDAPFGFGGKGATLVQLKPPTV